MSSYAGPDLSESNLILALDAGNAKSYPGSGTAWTDLSRNSNTGTLTNGPTYSSSNNGLIVFNGTTQYVAPTGLTDSFWQSNWTASFWVNFNTLNTTSDSSLDKTLIQHGTSILGVIGTRNGLQLSQRNSKIYFGLFNDDISGNTILSTNSWYNIVYTLNNTSYSKQIYVNGVLDNSGTGSGAYTGFGNNARICGVVFNFGVTFDGSMGSCNFYNRVLTASEIQQNFNAHRGRYGI